MGRSQLQGTPWHYEYHYIKKYKYRKYSGYSGYIPLDKRMCVNYCDIITIENTITKNRIQVEAKSYVGQHFLYVVLGNHGVYNGIKFRVVNINGVEAEDPPDYLKVDYYKNKGREDNNNRNNASNKNNSKTKYNKYTNEKKAKKRK